MRGRLWSDIAARVALTIGALLPYRHLLTFNTIYVTDDFFASDIFNGELPGRVLIGDLIRHGQFPLWTSKLCSGIPLATTVEPIGLGAFSLLSPAAALDLFVIVLLLVAAHGAYGFARRLDVGRPGAVLAGLSFAGSGFIACQLKHLAIVSTVVWLPVGLELLDRAFAASPPRRLARRALLLAAFGLVFAEQVLAGFPQSAYICALTYGSFAAYRASNHQRVGGVRLSLLLLGGFGLAMAIAGAAGAVVLLPVYELGKVSDRSQALGLAWSSMVPYWPPNVLTFLVPYINGDISNNTYPGPSLFWEDYGYVGAATFLLALYGLAREHRRPPVAFLGTMTLVAYMLVVGRNGAVFPLAYYLVPGMKLFRLPTRFLIVVELGLALLGGIGLTRLGADLERWFAPDSPRVPRLLVLSLCAFTMLDLTVHQPRQNPMVPASEWLTPPRSVDIIQAAGSTPRTFTLNHREIHRLDFVLAHGWQDLTLYYQLRDALPPNLGGGFWNVPSADCYAGLAPRWYVDVWSDHNRDGRILDELTHFDFTARTVQVSSTLPNVLRTFGVTHLLSSYPVIGGTLPRPNHETSAYIFPIDGATRVRFVRSARHVADDEQAISRLLHADFDPDREILLHDAPATVGPTVEQAVDAANVGRARAIIAREDSREQDIEADAPEDGFLLLADTFYPGWSAELDGRPVPIYRANLSLRGIELPKGQHHVRFSFTAPGFSRGRLITPLAISALLVWLAVAAYLDRRHASATRTNATQP